MSELTITPRGEKVVVLLILVLTAIALFWAFSVGEGSRCTWLVENDRSWIAERECPAAYLP